MRERLCGRGNGRGRAPPEKKKIEAEKGQNLGKSQGIKSTFFFSKILFLFFRVEGVSSCKIKLKCFFRPEVPPIQDGVETFLEQKMVA